MQNPHRSPGLLQPGLLTQKPPSGWNSPTATQDSDLTSQGAKSETDRPHEDMYPK